MENLSKKEQELNKLKSILNSCESNSRNRATAKLCWNLYNGVIDRSKYKHITHSAKGRHAFPARLKNIDKLKNRVNYLEGRLVERPIPVSCILDDDDSIKSKKFAIYQMRIREMEKAVDERMGKLEVTLANIDMEKSNVEQSINQLSTQIQEIQQYLQNGSQEEGQEEDKGLLAEMEQQLNMLTAAKKNAEQMKQQLFENFRIIQNFISANVDDLNIDMESIKLQKEYTFEDIKEAHAQRLLRRFRKTLHIPEVSKQVFRNGVVDGHQFYHVDFDYKSKKYTFEGISIMNLFYPETSERHVEDCPWVTIKDTVSAEDILKTYNITDSNVIVQLNNDMLRGLSNSSVATTPGNGTIMYGGTEQSSGKIVRYRTYFIESKPVIGYDGPNGYVVKYRGETPEERQKDERESNGTLYSRSVDVLKLAVTIGDPGNPIFQHIEEKKEVVRHPHEPSRLKLPVVGNTYNDITNQPYSLAWTTKELIELNNVIFFTIEKLINLSGVKGNIMDISQKPDDMDLETWEYKKKTGKAVIQTKKKGSNGFTYNQFQTYDDTLSDSIAQLFELVRIIDQMFDMITGISRQAMSQITQKDGKGTTEMAISQSDVIVEVIYWTHDNILARAQTLLVNLSMAYDNETDKYVQSADAMGQDIVKIPAGIFGTSYVDVICEASSTEQADMKYIKQMAASRLGAELDLGHVISLFGTKTLKELEVKTRKYAKDYKKFQQEMASNEQQATANIEAQREQMKIDAQKVKDELTTQIEKAKLALGEKQLEIETQKLALMKDQIDSKERTEIFKSNQNTGIEDIYLQEQKRASMVDESIRTYQAKANTLISQIKMINDKDFSMRKMAIDVKKSKNKAKEAIKD